MTDNDTDHMTINYQVAITPVVAQLTPESDMKPQSASEIDLHLVCACTYEVTVYGIGIIFWTEALV